MKQADENVLHVLTHVSGLGERGGVRDRERHVKHPRQRLREQGLPDTGRTDEQDVGFVDLDVVEHAVVIHALVMVIDRYRERLLRLFLPNHVLIKEGLDFLWCRAGNDLFLGFALFFFCEDLVAERDALIADVDVGSRDELLDALFGLPAEAAAQVFVAGHRRPLLLFATV